MEDTKIRQRLRSYVREGILNPRILKFGIVGATGVLVNMGSLYVLAGLAGIPYFLGSPIAIELSILSNFWLNTVWTWKDRSDAGTVWSMIWRYHVGAGVTAILGNYLILVALTELLNVNYLLSNLAGIAVGTLGNFVVNDVWTYKNRPSNE